MPIIKTANKFFLQAKSQKIVRQYIKYFINGSILGITAMLLQLLFSQYLLINAPYSYPLSVALTCSLLIPINFFIQRRIIFKNKGRFTAFFSITITGIIMVSINANIIKGNLVFIAPLKYVDQISFALAAILTSVPIFLFKRFYIFNK